MRSGPDGLSGQATGPMMGLQLTRSKLGFDEIKRTSRFHEYKS
jgi:hypothetical protein